ncbi:PstS family phosphate ABC transporter substrate-binding protein [Dysgonomonas sp. ZJ279]|uniref:PstS family phosphate ABC transporter substrate-binding protein n=1 Tax=Dysgonomonas sp. ZJ279 TaxID=2709796 RepID=UPI0013EDC4A7|nr:substrate-binding domain-containing protein [Dysgonomonas sp. ZJ279]
MQKKALRVIVSIVLILLLAFVGFCALIGFAFSGQSAFYSPFILTLFSLLSIWLIVWALKLLKTKIAVGSFIAILLSASIAVTIYEVRKSYINSIPTIDDQGVNLNDYQPFDKDSKVALLDGESTLNFEDNLPRIDGATALYPLYSAFVQATYPEGEYNPYGSIVMSNTTPEAYRRLLDGEVDVIFCAAPSKAQIEEAESEGKTFILRPIGREAFVFFVNINNPVDELSVEQIQDIYSGKITNWRQLGGDNQDIKAFQRPKNSGSQTMLEKIMEGAPLISPPLKDVATGMGGIIHQTAEYKNFNSAIGYTFLFFATEMIGNNQVKLLKVNGVYPDKASIKNNEYPFIGDFYAITLDTQNENVTKLIDWVTSDQGQSLVEKTGYASLSMDKIP